MKFKKHANIESVTEEFDRRWNSILSEASYRIQELLVKETHEVRDRITEGILNVEEIITAKYGRPKAEQTINKALELSTKFQEGLTHKRTKKLKNLLETNGDISDPTFEDTSSPEVATDTLQNSEQEFVDSGDRDLAVQIGEFMSNIREHVTNQADFKRALQVEIEDLGPEENTSGVNPLPAECPLLLVDLEKASSSDIDSVLRECNREREDPSIEISREGVRSCAETSEGEHGTETERERNDGTSPEAVGSDKRASTNTKKREMKNPGYQTVVNLSKRELTGAEISLLSKGLKFCPTPKKVDIYSLRKDIREYVRRVRLREYFYSEQDDVGGSFSDLPAFRKKSSWTPDGNRERAIEAYVEALERELLTHDFDMTYQRNLSREEQQALQNLRKYDDVIIKQADKGSAVVIMDKEAYLQEAMRQLNDSEIYQPLVKDSTRDMIKKVNERIQETHRKGNIDDKTRDYLLDSGDERAGKFYLLPKIHKKGCPGRPVISGCNTPTEKISRFVDHHLRPLVPEINSYIKDTNDFIRKLMEIDTLPDGAILCTVDVVGLYPHIPHDEGLQAVKEALVAWDSNLDERKKLGDLKNDIVDLTEIVLKNNNFVFDGKHFIQKLGTAIGTRMAPSYANIFMDKLERQFIEQAEMKPHTWWRYIDDIFIIWTEGENSLRDFIDYLNSEN